MEKVVLNDEQLDSVNGGSRITYTVQPGDTLESIAKRMGVSARSWKSGTRLRIQTF